MTDIPISSLPLDPSPALTSKLLSADGTGSLMSVQTIVNLIPAASTSTPGVVKADGTTIAAASDGTLSLVNSNLQNLLQESAGGDLTGTIAAPVVSKIGGVPIIISTPQSGDQLTYVAGQWVNLADSVVDGGNF